MNIKQLLGWICIFSVPLVSIETFAADYPANIDYGQQGDFIAKRATENGRAAIIMPIGPVLVSQPETPGSQSVGLPDGRQMFNGYWDLSNLTDPQLIEPLWCSQDPSRDCQSSSPIGAHGTLVRIDDDANQAYLFEPANFNAPWTTFDAAGATSAEQMGKVLLPPNEIGRILRYHSLTSPFTVPQYWSYDQPPTSTSAIDGSVSTDYFIRDNRNLDSTLVESWFGTLFTEWDHLGTAGVSGFPIWLGNHLIYASDQLQTGIAIYDMSGFKQGQVPRLLADEELRVNKPEPNNGIDEHIGGYWLEAYGTDRVVFAARSIQSPTVREKPALFIVNFEDRTNPRISCEIYFNQDTSTIADGDGAVNPMYVNFQDEYVYTDNFKINIFDCEDAYVDDQMIDETEFANIVYAFADTDNHCDGSQYFRPLGQVGVFGGYDVHHTNYIVEYTGSELPREPAFIRVNDGAKTIGQIFGQYSQSTAGNNRASWRFDDLAAGDQMTVNGETNGEVRTVVSVVQDPNVNEQGLCFMVTQDEPDTRPPFISGTAPKAGATNVPIDTFIHIHIPETLRTESLIDAFVVTNDANGDVVSARKQLSHTGMFSIWPDDDLATDASYTVSVRGVQDFMGNTMSNQSFQFATGGEIIVVPPTPESESSPAPTFGSSEFPGTPYYTNQSSQLSCRPEAVDNNLWVVNPDNHSISVIDTELTSDLVPRLVSSEEILFPSYKTPTSITDVGTHYAVTFRDDDKIVFFNATTFAPEVSVDTGHGTQPIASVADSSLSSLYVSLYGSEEVVKIDLAAARSGSSPELIRLSVGPKPMAMVLVNDDDLLVTRYISARDHGEVYRINTAGSMSLNQTIIVNKVTIPDDIDNGSGVPNFLSSITVAPDGQTAYVAAAKANTDNADLDDDNTIRPMLAILDLESGLDKNSADTSNPLNTVDFDNAADPAGVIFLPDGETRVTSMQGNNIVYVQNIIKNTAATFTTGSAPQHLCTTARVLYVKNFTDRTVSAIDMAEYMYDGQLNPTTVSIPTVSPGLELLSDGELNGLQIFYHSEAPQMGPEGYMSCASCHQDGGQDGRVWNLVGLGEGLRNTLSLNGTSGTRFGNLHWSQNFDEVQDFEIQMEQLNAGTGLLEFTFGESDTPLNTRTAGQSTDLDDLAAYISGLGKDTVKHSPYRNRATGELTSSALLGQQVFMDNGCAVCHSGKAFRDGLAHDVGTIDISDSMAKGQVDGLTAVRTPTLIELWETAPYLHNGSAQTLGEVFDMGAEHEVAPGDRASLTEFLNSIDKDLFIEDDASFPED